MKKETETLKDIYARWKTEDLIKALSIDRGNYEPTAIEIMKMEVHKRDIKDKEISDFQKDYSKEEETLIEGGNLYCPSCHSLDIRKERRLWYLAIVPVIGYFLLPKYQCVKCGFTFGKTKTVGKPNKMEGDSQVRKEKKSRSEYYKEGAIICPRCGYQNNDVAQNCANCRINLKWAIEEETT